MHNRPVVPWALVDEQGAKSGLCWNGDRKEGGRERRSCLHREQSSETPSPGQDQLTLFSLFHLSLLKRARLPTYNSTAKPSREEVEGCLALSRCVVTQAHWQDAVGQPHLARRSLSFWSSALFIAVISLISYLLPPNIPKFSMKMKEKFARICAHVT